MFASGTKASGGGGDITVNRGNVTDPDWQSVDLTKDDAYHDLDLSGIVPVGTTFVQIIIQFLGFDTTLYLSLKEKDYISAELGHHLSQRVAGTPYMAEVWLGVNADRVIEYKSKNALWLDLQITVAAWKVPA
ncbi:hypothetical protein LCGC14_1862020 [marine sediment metagenome]|uniref:Uncharacterized protein n=1 Tax=marine sediment metagenome TaxID=412755 RepID=A0A0F9GVL9_9ZZZZ